MPTPLAQGPIRPVALSKQARLFWVVAPPNAGSSTLPLSSTCRRVLVPVESLTTKPPFCGTVAVMLGP
ncbi:hypothetical protein [Xylophilus sp. ASV27]|uniref:hypothetical protein n=1 Tax=Xylophilus sp. ASV27 TaxID=2795129 RepID=UPI001E31B6F7|nr:hypothetical protein [Xylophilus sp. ASV27]